MNISSKEVEYISDIEFLMAKNRITENIRLEFQVLRDSLKQIIENTTLTLPAEIDITQGKISKGENYRGLPFLVLDFPRCFQKQSICTFRTMFWWGNFFSFTWHLQGEHLNKLRSVLAKNISRIYQQDLFICVNSTPWEYHYKLDNYVPVDDLTEEVLLQKIQEQQFLKFSSRFPLEQAANLTESVKERFTFYLELITI